MTIGSTRQPDSIRARQTTVSLERHESLQFMAAGIITDFHHVNVTVPRALEQVAKDFYRVSLGLEEVPKPEASRGRGGAWYQLGSLQLHLSVEDVANEQPSSRHVCFVVENLNRAEEHLASAGVTILPDPRPVPGTERFYVRDPGGNLIEITERKAN
jgi:catechol 2,3-dioxygenase-like lactoylglutathione lyase family enzyme